MPLLSPILDSNASWPGAARYFAVLGVLVASVVGVFGLQTWQLERASNNLEERREERVHSALLYAQRDFQSRQQDLLSLARTVSREQRVIDALLRASRGESDAAAGAADYLQKLDPSAWVEIYDVLPRLQAWHGTSMPLDEAPFQPKFLKSSQTVIAKDNDWRTVLAVWLPVTEGRRPLGAVRVMRELEVRRRITNRFLREYSVARVWSNSTGIELTARFGAGDPTEDESSTVTRALYASDGEILGWVKAEPPSDEALLQEVAKRNGDVAALLLTVLLMWILSGFWVLYLRAPTERRKWATAGGLVAGLWLARFALVALDVPGRWQTGKEPLAPLFDPTRFASTAGFGLLKSTGDFILTALFAVLSAAVFIHLTTVLVRRLDVERVPRTTRAVGGLGIALGAFLAFSAALVLLGVLASIVRRAVLDSTLDYFTRSGIIPGPNEWLVAVVFAGLILYTLTVVLLISSLMAWVMAVAPPYIATRSDGYKRGVIVLLAAALPTTVLYVTLDLDHLVPWAAALAFLVAACAAAYALIAGSGEGIRLLKLRGVLMTIFVVAVLLYPMYYGAMEMKQRVQMIDASQSFNEGRDPRVIYGIEQVLSQVRRNEDIAMMLERDRTGSERRRLDSLVTQVLRTSLIGSMGPYDVSLSLFSPRGNVAGRDIGAEAVLGRYAVDQIDSVEFDILRAMHAEAGTDEPLVEQMTGRLERDRFQYAGVAPIPRSDGTGTVGWAMARVEPYTLLRHGEASFPRVLLPEGVVESVHASLSIAEFQNGVLVRSLGRPFGRYRLSESVMDRLSAETELWIREHLEDRSYLTYYRRQDTPPPLDAEGSRPRTGQSIVAVRGTAVNTFDHLFYLLRLIVAGLMLGLPIHLIGVYMRWNAGLLPAARVPFRDKVLNAFLGVGIISVAAVGIVGREVVRESTEASVHSSLRQHLERVEQTLALESMGDELPYRVIERMGVDSLASRAGLDLNIYRGTGLIDSSRPQLIQDRLLDTRLPIEVYQALFFEGHRFATTTEYIGTFAYQAGFRTLLNEQGLPRLVVSVPILPEQERIEEEQARTIAYLFGALLILILIVMLTASILADALARPIARLRAGLEAVARGRFERNIPVRSRDEIGELVETFNSMQDQLAESRRKLAQHERQLAWREMARQVAHEIKNPLTPMKLSVQHLRRAFEDVDGGGAAPVGRESKFGRMFDRVTGTLIEQINSLARIADEFSSFAKLPKSVHEDLDLNAVIEQASHLMQVEQSGELVLRLHDEALIVRADREELSRVYINLVKNAFQAIPEDRDGLVIVETEPQIDEDGRAWAVSQIIDNGVGVPEELRESIFEPNFSTKTSGMGLGLAIVRKSITEMNGEIGFDSKEGEGSTFWVKLPLAEQEEEE